MKNVILTIMCSVLLISCNIKKETQYGIITDVKYKERYCTIETLLIASNGQLTLTQPQAVIHPETWHATICYNDSIYIRKIFNYKVNVGDTVSRTIYK